MLPLFQEVLSDKKSIVVCYYFSELPLNANYMPLQLTDTGSGNESPQIITVYPLMKWKPTPLPIMLTLRLLTRNNKIIMVFIIDVDQRPYS